MTCDVVSLATARRLKDAGWTADTELFFVGDVLYRRKDVTDIAEYDVSAPCLCDFIELFTSLGFRVEITKNDVAILKPAETDSEGNDNWDLLVLCSNKPTVENAAECWMWLRGKGLVK